MFYLYLKITYRFFGTFLHGVSFVEFPAMGCFYGHFSEIWPCYNRIWRYWLWKLIGHREHKSKICPLYMYIKYQNNISRIWPIYKAYRLNNMVWKQDALNMRVFFSDRAKVVSLYLIFGFYGLDDQTYSNVWYNSCYRYVEPSQWPYGYCNWGACLVYWHIPTLSKSLFQPTAFSVLPEDNTRC